MAKTDTDKYRSIKLNKRMVNKISNEIRQGVPANIAAQCAGISGASYNNYMNTGFADLEASNYEVENQTIFASLYREITRAECSYKSYLYTKENEHIFELNNPTVLMNAMKSRVPETHNPTNTNLNIEANTSREEQDPVELINKIKNNIGYDNEQKKS